MKTLKKWKSRFWTVGNVLLIFLFLHWMMTPDYSVEHYINRRILFCIAVMFLLAAWVLGIVRKALEEERKQD